MHEREFIGYTDPIEVRVIARCKIQTSLKRDTGNVKYDCSFPATHYLKKSDDGLLPICSFHLGMLRAYVDRKDDARRLNLKEQPLPDLPYPASLIITVDMDGNGTVLECPDEILGFVEYELSNLGLEGILDWEIPQKPGVYRVSGEIDWNVEWGEYSAIAEYPMLYNIDCEPLYLLPEENCEGEEASESSDLSNRCEETGEAYRDGRLV